MFIQMEGVIRGAYRCHENRTLELSNRIFERNLATKNPQMVFDPRPVKTRQVLFPMLECNQPSEYPIIEQPTHTHDSVFLPGTSAPFNGYQTAIDNESRIQNRFFPLQSAPQSKYIPSSKSDMYQVQPLPKDDITRYNLTENPYSNLYTSSEQHARETWDNPHPNPYPEIGGDFFYNHTRNQVKNLDNCV